MFLTRNVLVVRHGELHSIGHFVEPLMNREAFDRLAGQVMDFDEITEPTKEDSQIERRERDRLTRTRRCVHRDRDRHARCPTSSHSAAEREIDRCDAVGMEFGDAWNWPVGSGQQ